MLSTNTLTTEFIRGGGMVYSIKHTQVSGLPPQTSIICSHANHRGDIIARSDSTGSLTSYALYEAYGTRPYEWGTDPDRHKANTKDEETDLNLLNEGMRYRDLETGTFLTRDPIGYADGPNVYCYVHCNPITRFDPLGLEDQEDVDTMQTTLNEDRAAYNEYLKKEEDTRTGFDLADLVSEREKQFSAFDQRQKNIDILQKELDGNRWGQTSMKGPSFDGIGMVGEVPSLRRWDKEKKKYRYSPATKDEYKSYWKHYANGAVRPKTGSEINKMIYQQRADAIYETLPYHNEEKAAKIYGTLVPWGNMYAGGAVSSLPFFKATRWVVGKPMAAGKGSVL